LLVDDGVVGWTLTEIKYLIIKKYTRRLHKASFLVGWGFMFSTVEQSLASANLLINIIKGFFSAKN
jgi:hypothetical protein